MSSPPPSQASRLQETLRTVPVGTLSLVALMVLLHVGAYLLSEGSLLNKVSIAAYPVLFQHQWYRVLSGAFFHGGLMHIGMNMMSFWYMGVSLERTFGTVPFLVIMLWCVVLGNLLYVACCAGMAAGPGRGNSVGWLQYSSVGFSGVLFSAAVMESFLTREPTRSVFGCFTVPTKLYPWVLLAVLQVGRVYSIVLYTSTVYQQARSGA